MTERPTKDPRIVILDLFDRVWAELMERLDGLSDDEYLWEPVAGCWSVRSDGSIDGVGDRDADPAPVTTIAWRTWHIAFDCLDSYNARLIGEDDVRSEDSRWPLDSTTALRDMDASWRRWRGTLESRSSDQWWTEIGEEFGPFGQHSLYDLSLHAMREVIHHGAEIALLRDLWRANQS
jgi:hypothetical protein